MKKEELLKAITKLSKTKSNNPISTMAGINVDDLMCAIDGLNKITTYGELLRENKKLKEINKKAIEYIKENKEKYYQDWGQDDGSCDTYLDENEVLKLLQILEDVE